MPTRADKESAPHRRERARRHRDRVFLHERRATKRLAEHHGSAPPAMSLGRAARHKAENAGVSAKAIQALNARLDSFLARDANAGDTQPAARARAGTDAAKRTVHDRTNAWQCGSCVDNRTNDLGLNYGGRSHCFACKETRTKCGGVFLRDKPGYAKHGFHLASPHAPGKPGTPPVGGSIVVQADARPKAKPPDPLPPGATSARTRQRAKRKTGGKDDDGPTVAPSDELARAQARVAELSARMQANNIEIPEETPPPEPQPPSYHDAISQLDKRCGTLESLIDQAGDPPPRPASR